MSVRVSNAQTHLVASTAKSLAEAKVNANLHSLAIYDGAARGYEHPTVPVIGFAMYELAAGVGFIQRLLIDQSQQGRGYGKAAMIEMIRRLRLHPEVEMIATSYRRENEIAAKLYAGLGFVPWPLATLPGEEVFVRLP